MSTRATTLADMQAVILAGGQSRRFGSDKARAIVHGRPLIAHVAEAARPIVRSIVVVADRAGKYADLGYRTLADPVPDAGPMSGLARALELTPGDFCLVLPCDVVGLRTAWLRTLMDAATGELDAVVFASDRLEPLPALYHARLADEALSRATGGPRALVRLLTDVRSERIPAPAGWTTMVRVTRPSDLTPD